MSEAMHALTCGDVVDSVATESFVCTDVRYAAGVLVMPAGVRHRDVIAAGGARGLLVTLKPSFPRMPRQWRVYHGGPLSRMMIALHRDLRLGGRAESLAIEERLLDTLVDEPDKREANAVRRAQELIERHAERPLRLGDVAAQAGVARTTSSKCSAVVAPTSRCPPPRR